MTAINAKKNPRNNAKHNALRAAKLRADSRASTAALPDLSNMKNPTDMLHSRHTLCDVVEGTGV